MENRRKSFLYIVYLYGRLKVEYLWLVDIMVYTWFNILFFEGLKFGIFVFYGFVFKCGRLMEES